MRGTLPRTPALASPMDTRIHLSLAAAVLLLAGCDPQPTTNQVSANTEALADAVANAQAGTTTAEPIHLTEKTAVIDFDYKIPARAAAAPALSDHLLADAESSEKRRVGKGCVSTCRTGGARNH